MYRVRDCIRANVRCIYNGRDGLHTDIHVHNTHIMYTMYIVYVYTRTYHILENAGTVDAG